MLVKIDNKNTINLDHIMKIDKLLINGRYYLVYILKRKTLKFQYENEDYINKELDRIYQIIKEKSNFYQLDNHVIINFDNVETIEINSMTTELEIFFSIGQISKILKNEIIQRERIVLDKHNSDFSNLLSIELLKLDMSLKYNNIDDLLKAYNKIIKQLKIKEL